MFKIKYIILFYFLFLFASCKKDDNSLEKKASTNKINSTTVESYFQKINSSQSNIVFNNIIKDDITTNQNLFDYDYFFNGSGVGVEDFNNDGLLDIFFCGNQVPNKLYLNKGNLVFEDVTEKANINTRKNWANGVTFVDINNDGFIDIYVSQGGLKEKSLRKNVLYINQGNLTYKEEGKKYGLDDTGISTQSAFFDYDKDGDLDCIVMNENSLYGLPPDKFYKIIENEELLLENCSHLYENNNGKFKNITKQAGLLSPTFGLGLCVSDINNDNWLDIYIANDYYVPDALYINNKNGTFTNNIKNFTKQVSFYGMGVDIADVNNDNLQDIFVLDMASNDHIRSKTLMASMNVEQQNLLTNKLDLQYQFMFNSLQLNIDNSKFHNISQSTGLSKTDWSWAGLIFDFNNDQNEDIFVTNGYRKYALDNDIRNNILKAKHYYKGNVPLEIKQNIHNSLPSEKLPNILFKNEGNITFTNITTSTELNEPSFSNGAVYADLDNDGDLDIVINNIDDEAFLYKNLITEKKLGNFLKIKTKGETSEDFAKVIIHYDNITKTKEVKRVRGYLSAVDKAVHFGLGKKTIVDSIKIIWQSGKYQKIKNIKANSTLLAEESNAKLNYTFQSKKNRPFNKNTSIVNFQHKENIYDDFKTEILLPYKQSTFGGSISKGDINNDGLDDLFFNSAYGQESELFTQTKTGFKKTNLLASKNTPAFEDMESKIFDINNDGSNDILIVSGGNEFIENSNNFLNRIYLNDGKGLFKKDIFFDKNQKQNSKALTKIDFDNDGDFDVIVGNRIVPQKYPISQGSVFFENINGTLKDVTDKIAPELKNFGIINKIITTDFNNDDNPDFIAIGEWTHIGMFLNDNGVFKDVSGNYGLNNDLGWWFSIIETDINKDGLKDYIVGNIGQNIKFKVNKKKPLKIYATDFDENRTHDIVLSTTYNNKPVPIRGRECSSQQMPFIKEKIPTFIEFANSSLEDIYGEKIHSAYYKEVNQFSHVLLLNMGNNKFEKIEIKGLAKTMPFLDFVTLDYNNDGFEDILAVGNIYNTEVETPRLDNPFALILESNQKNNYKIIGPDKTGLYINGNAKSVEKIYHKGLNKELYIISINNGLTEVFEFNSDAN